MTRSDVSNATALLAQYDSYTARIGLAEGAVKLSDLYSAIEGTGLESQALSAGRSNVSDMLTVAQQAVLAQLSALGVTP